VNSERNLELLIECVRDLSSVNAVLKETTGFPTLEQRKRSGMKPLLET
jgi:hypothetical protein